MTENSLNQFNKDSNPDRVFNIYTGTSCKEGIEDFCRNVESIGNEAGKCYTGMRGKS